MKIIKYLLLIGRCGGAAPVGALVGCGLEGSEPASLV